MAPMSDVILIVEDEPDIATTISYNLRKSGFETVVAHSGQDGLRSAKRSPTPDLILLDLMLPDMSGHEVCAQLRESSRLGSIPIIMLTARGEEEDRVKGFENGADDYVTKPFSVRELVARIRAVLRRSRQDTEEEMASLRAGLIRMDLDAHRAWSGTQELELTAIEYRLLSVLVKRKGRVQSREQLIDEVWGLGTAITHRTVDVHVKRLRGKIGEAASYIDTVWGVGYRLVVPESDGTT